MLQSSRYRAVADKKEAKEEKQNFLIQEDFHFSADTSVYFLRDLNRINPLCPEQTACIHQTRLNIFMGQIGVVLKNLSLSPIMSRQVDNELYCKACTFDNGFTCKDCGVNNNTFSLVHRSCFRQVDIKIHSIFLSISFFSELWKFHLNQKLLNVNHNIINIY